jgi:glucose-1-phosphate thymidylyltransferase
MTDYYRDKKNGREVIGLLPAAGQASRITPLPCSKELYPIGFQAVGEGRSLRPKVACQYLLEKMCLAGITKVYIVLHEGKWDIPGYLGDGSMINMNLAYLMMRLRFGTPYTLDQAYPFLKDASVAFGFPDVIFQPDDAFVQLLGRQAETNADIVLGLFPTDQPQIMDMVDVDKEGRIRSLIIKPLHTQLQYSWIISVWTPVFTSFLHEHLIVLQKSKEQCTAINGPKQQELSVGHVLQAAIGAGLEVQGVRFPNHTYLDIGTPDNLMKATYDTRFNADSRS